MVAAAVTLLTAGMGGAAAQALPLVPVVDKTVAVVQSTASGVVQDPVGTVTNAVGQAPLPALPVPAPTLPAPTVPTVTQPAPAPGARSGAEATPAAATLSTPKATPTTTRAPVARTATPTASARAARSRTAAAPRVRATSRTRTVRRARRATTTAPARAVLTADVPVARRSARVPAAAIEPDRGGGLVRTVRDVVEVIPGWIKLLLAALVLLAAGLGARALVSGARARRLQHQRTELQGDVDLLEQALLPNVLEALGGAGATSVALRPADGPGAGGDFYDAVALPGGRSAVILGDLTGHGREALAQTALVRYTLRAYLQAGLAPRQVLQLAGQVLDDQLAEGQFATVIVAVHDPLAGLLTYAAAGHPAPIIRGCGPTEPLDTAFSPAIGVGLRTGLRETTVPFASGMVACLFTDGLIEAHTPAGQLGRDGLGEIVDGLGPEDTAAAVLERVRAAADDASDDLTVCLLRGTGSTAGVRVEELEVDAAALRGPRANDFLFACGVRTRVVADALLRASAIEAEWGGAVLRVRHGVVDALRPPADIQDAVAG